MFYEWIAMGFGYFAIISKKFPKVQSIICIWYMLTSLLMMLFQSSDWASIYIMRYFLYIISMLLLVIVPILLFTLAVLVIGTVLKQHYYFVWKVINLVAAGVLIAFCGFSLWNIIFIKEVQLPLIISLYSSIAIYFTALFISYLIVSYSLQLKSKRASSYLLIVLGTDIDDEGQVQIDLKKRLDKAIVFYDQLNERSQQNSYFIVTGGNPTKNGKTEAEGMAHYLISKGISKYHIIKEPSARNTKENFLFSRPFFNNIAKNKRMIIVTSTYHLMRSAYYARKVGVKVTYLGAKTNLLVWPYAVVREFIALLLLTKEISVLYIIYIILVEIFKMLN